MLEIDKEADEKNIFAEIKKVGVWPEMNNFTVYLLNQCDLRLNLLKIIYLRRIALNTRS